MEKAKLIFEDGIEKELEGIFYLYDSKYYFIYTEKEIDENGYVVLYLVQVGKEIKNTPNGPLDTGYMIGIEISNDEDWIKVQNSITKIVEDKKNNTQSSDISYLPINMLSTLKINGKKTFRLMKEIVQNNFGINVDDKIGVNDVLSQDMITSQNVEENKNSTNDTYQGEVIIDYRNKFFEEQEKNMELESQILTLKQKIEEIKKIVE